MKRLKELRIQNKLSAKNLAQKLKLSQSTISLYESGKREPDFETLKQIATFFDVSTDYLLENTNAPLNLQNNNISFVSFNFKENLRHNLKRFRKLNNLTQAEVARHLNITPAGYSNYEQGISTPDIEAISKIAKIFHVSVDELLNGQQLPKTNTIVVFGRGTGREEYHMSDEQIKLLKSLIENMKDPDVDKF